MPTVSVIILVYNVERYIERCLRSVLSQTFRDFELILVDDASSDASTEVARRVVREMGSPEGGMRVITHGQNQGPSCARNTGLDAATGTYVYFADSDDYLEPRLLEQMIRTVTDHGADIAMCGSRNVYESGSGPEPIDLPDFEGETTGEGALLLLMNGRCRAYLCMQLFKTDLFRDIRFPEGTVYEDRLTLPYLLLNAGKVVFIREVLYNYLQREGSITRSFQPQILKTMDSIRELKGAIRERLRSKEWKQAFFRYEYLNIQTIVFTAIIHSTRYEDVREVLAPARRNIRVSELVSRYGVMPKSVISLFLFKLHPHLFWFFFKYYRAKKQQAA